MPRILSKPTVRAFEVEDEAGNWNLSFRQLTEGDRIELEDLQSELNYRYNEAGNFIGTSRKTNTRAIERRGVYRTLVSSDLAYEDGTLVFDSKDGLVRKAMTEKQFNDRWDLLPREIADVVVKYYYEVNPLGE